MSARAEDPRRLAGAQQRKALDPGATVWVQASAGTGKTKVLVDRVLALLLAEAPPQRIRCLTFTKAAAAEMKNRLLQALAAWATLPGAELTAALFELLGRRPTAEEEARAARLFARVLDAPGGLRIQTLHAFCQGLLARFPLEAGVSPRFRLVEERSAGALLAAARADLFAEAELPGREQDLRWALEHLLLAGGETSFAALTQAIVARRGAFEAALAGRGVVGAVAVVEAACELAAGDTRESLLAAALAEPALPVSELRELAGLLAGGGKLDSDCAAAIQPLLAAAPDQRAALAEDYIKGFLTDGDTVRTRIPSKALRDRRPDLATLFQEEGERLAALRRRLAGCALVEDCRALFTVAERLLASYGRRKAAQGALDYADLIAATARLLADPGRAAWVLYKLDEGIEHLLIDEAQDTSPEQWEVVTQLTAEFHAGLGAHEDRATGQPRPRTVFAVGDAKQSIYRFQGADPLGFRQAEQAFRQRVEAIRQLFLAVPLSHSFRSAEAVLRAVDRVFALPAAQAGVAEPDGPVRHLATRLGQAGRVELWPLRQPAPAEPSAPWAPPTTRRDRVAPAVALAESIAATLAGWFAADPARLGPGDAAWLASKDRAVAPGDVLVLVRQRGALFHALARALKQQGVPVAGVDRMVLPQQTAVRDLLALGRFLLLPEDDLSLAEVMKGPLGGLDDEDLLALAAGRRGALWQALGERQGLKPAYAALRQRLEELLARADYTPPYELFAGLLGAGGGRRRWLERLGEEAADPLDEFLAQALLYEREAAPSLQGFLAWIEQGQLEVKRDLEASGQAVRIMTVHGAKGLQAPIVFLPDTTTLPRGGEALLADRERRLVLRGGGLLKGVAFAARLQDEEKRLTLEEYRRLLYVALTRAEDRLYLCGAVGAKGLAEGSWYALAAEALAGLDRQAAQQLAEVLVAEEAAQAAPPERPRPPPPRAAAPPLAAVQDRAPPPEPVPPRPLAPSRPEQEDPPSLSPLAGDQGRWQRGRLLHRLLQTLPELPPARRAAAARRFLAQPAHGLEAGSVAAWTDELLAVLALPEAALLFGPASRAEVPVAGLVGGTRLAGRIDRLAVTETAVWFCDYKTNRPPPAAEDAVAAQYLRQLAAYGALLADVYKGKEIKAFLLWTDGPRLMQISAERLARHAP